MMEEAWLLVELVQAIAACTLCTVSIYRTQGCLHFPVHHLSDLVGIDNSNTVTAGPVRPVHLGPG